MYLHAADESLGPLAAPGWWSSADLVHGIEVTDDTKVVSMHQNSTWRELDLEWNTDTSDPDHGNTIVFADFKKSDDTK